MHQALPAIPAGVENRRFLRGHAESGVVGSWNDWAVARLCCVVFNVFSGREAVPGGIADLLP